LITLLKRKQYQTLFANDGLIFLKNK